MRGTRMSQGVIVVCAWCVEGPEAAELYGACGYTVSHTICPECELLHFGTLNEFGTQEKPDGSGHFVSISGARDDGDRRGVRRKQ